ncbi:hypothetical protein BJ912DRAFT_288268 [Pholiota molesta]|nr:hypothetical protein BJ912DRAFT_288268 [Pholiota molesta]
MWHLNDHPFLFASRLGLAFYFCIARLSSLDTPLALFLLTSLLFGRRRCRFRPRQYSRTHSSALDTSFNTHPSLHQHHSISFI